MAGNGLGVHGQDVPGGSLGKGSSHRHILKTESITFLSVRVSDSVFEWLHVGGIECPTTSLLWTAAVRSGHGHHRHPQRTAELRTPVGLTH